MALPQAQAKSAPRRPRAGSLYQRAFRILIRKRQVVVCARSCRLHSRGAARLTAPGARLSGAYRWIFEPPQLCFLNFWH